MELKNNIASSKESSMVPGSSRLFHDLALQKSVCAISRRPSPNSWCPSYEKNGLGALISSMLQVSGLLSIFYRIYLICIELNLAKVCP